MKLPIKKEYFDAIERGDKIMEFRDAHITFECEETKRVMRKEVIGVMMAKRRHLDRSIAGLFEDNYVIAFRLK